MGDTQSCQGRLDGKGKMRRPLTSVAADCGQHPQQEGLGSTHALAAAKGVDIKKPSILLARGVAERDDDDTHITDAVVRPISGLRHTENTSESLESDCHQILSQAMILTRTSTDCGTPTTTPSDVMSRRLAHRPPPIASRSTRAGPLGAPCQTGVTHPVRGGAILCPNGVILASVDTVDIEMASFCAKNGVILARRVSAIERPTKRTMERDRKQRKSIESQGACSHAPPRRLFTVLLISLLS